MTTNRTYEKIFSVSDFDTVRNKIIAMSTKEVKRARYKFLK